MKNYNIDNIMDMLDWNNSVEVQNHGIELAKKIKSINVFFQPLDPLYNKNVWENCAKIIAEKSDEVLEPYLIKLFEWLQDLNWPGAIIILERLKKFKSTKIFLQCKNECINAAKALNDEIWLENLMCVKHDIAL